MRILICSPFVRVWMQFYQLYWMPLASKPHASNEKMKKERILIYIQSVTNTTLEKVRACVNLLTTGDMNRIACAQPAIRSSR